MYRIIEENDDLCLGLTINNPDNCNKCAFNCFGICRIDGLNDENCKLFIKKFLFEMMNENIRDNLPLISKVLMRSHKLKIKEVL